MDDNASANGDCNSAEYDVCRSRYVTTYSRRHSSALYSGWFMILEVLLSVAEVLQLDCPSCAAAQKINLPKYREGYEGSETTVGKLSKRRI